MSTVEIVSTAKSNDTSLTSSSISPQNKTSNIIFYCYMIGIVLWLLIIYFLQLYKGADLIVWLLLLIPIIVLGVGAYNSRRLSPGDIDKTSSTATILSVGFVITVPLLVWAGNNSKDRSKFVKIIIFALILALLTLLDFWVHPEYIPIVKHSKSILLTFFVVLVIFGFYGYFLEKSSGYFTSRETTNVI
ncbi:MAG: hypothetical protein Solumvirus1_29 [Solumvirus sp.]|uniref:Uncharacterized protein n=1 Tax=Solumvirus sp. TaxID=2487773 RepID=A0A3G5AHT8_9VIRU|nr:MAG: hypothetical protein Solumvirus1_29 [Solumvirus sp.]